MILSGKNALVCRFSLFVGFVFFPVILLWLLSSCVSIPVNHFTVEQNGQTCSVTERCLCENSVLPDPVLDEITQTGGLDPQRIVLLNWNTHKETSTEWFREVPRMLAGVDLLTLQEAVLTDDLRNLLADGYAEGWILASAFTQSGSHTGVLTASRVLPDFSCSFRVAEPIIVVPKTVLINRYPIAGSKETLLLVNMHMINFSFAVAAYREQLQKASELISQHSGPLLIAGDFNSWSKWRTAILQQFADGLGAATVGFSPDNRSTVFGHALDYIFYRDLELVKSSVERESISDHNPLRAVFRLPDEK